MGGSRAIHIVLADDDPDDQLLVRDALQEANVDTALHVVDDGIALLEHLRRTVAAGGDPPRPDLVLLDLNMPRMSGHEALREIKRDPDLRAIPVVVLTTSTQEVDVDRTYDLGGNSFISKPPSFPGLVDVMQALDRYWVRTAEVPVRR